MIKIPYKLVAGIMLIPVTANEKEGFFAFDTGAMQTAVNKAYFPEMQGEHINIAKFSEGVKENAAEEGILNTLRFSDIERLNVSVLIMDLMYVENALKVTIPDLRFLGTLGIDVIKNYNILLEYSFEKRAAIPMRYENLPVIEAEVANRTCDFVLDTGASICLLGQSFQDDPQLIPSSKTPSIVTIPVVRVGENEYENITATISDISAIKKKVPVEGVIGYQVLSPQRSVLDFKNNQLIMEKAQDNEGE